MNYKNNSGQESKVRLLDDFQEDALSVSLHRNFFTMTDAKPPMRKYSLLRFTPSKFELNSLKVRKYGYLLKRLHNKEEKLE